MRTICFDLRALQIGHEHRGIGMYIKSVLECLPPDDNKYIFYAFDKNNPLENLGIEFQNSYKLIQTPTIKTALNSPRDIVGLMKLINHRFRRLKKIRPDVFVQFDFTLGIPRWRKTKKIIIGYDLIPLIMKNEYLPSVSFALKQSAPTRKTPRHLLRSLVYRLRHGSFVFKNTRVGFPKTLKVVVRSMYYNLKYSLHYKAYKSADEIICISRSTAEDFNKYLGISKNKLHAIPLAPVLSATEPDYSVVNKISKPYIFYIGGTDSRKKIQDIVYAFNIAKGRGADISLVLAGNEFNKLEHVPSIDGRNAILKSPYIKDIHLVGFVSDAQKMGLYQCAHAFVFCTIYEGFGLPILEAMSCHCPVISYNNSSIPEAAGDAAILIETGDYVAMARNILALKDITLRKKLIKSGARQAKKFNWHYTAQEMHSVIKNVT